MLLSNYVLFLLISVVTVLLAKLKKYLLRLSLRLGRPPASPDSAKEPG